MRLRHRHQRPPLSGRGSEDAPPPGGVEPTETRSHAIDRTTLDAVRQMARKLKQHPSCATQDTEDLEQELAVHLVQRWPSFDPSRSSKPQFTWVLLWRAAADIITHLSASKRDCRREAPSLSSAALESATPVGKFTRGRGPLQQTDLSLDLHAATSQLSPTLRWLCEQLRHHNVTAIVGANRVSRSKIYRLIHEIRSQFAKLGLAEYARET